VSQTTLEEALAALKEGQALDTVTAQNECLAGTRREPRNQLIALKEGVDRLAQPPSCTSEHDYLDTIIKPQ